MNSTTPATVCAACGNHGVQPSVVEGMQVLECRMCGQLSGDDEVIAQVLLRREAREAGVDAEAWPLVKTLSTLRGIHPGRASGGDPFMRVPPFVQFTVGDNRLTQVDNLAHSLALCARELTNRWSLRVIFNGAPGFELVPIVDAAHTDERTVELLQHDLEVIGRAVTRDTMLSWWKK